MANVVRRSGRTARVLGKKELFDVPVLGSFIAAAGGIQRALRDHRESTGFALAVRIGVHAADATQRGDDFSGMGVHVAARIGGLAGAGEVLASAETLREAGGGVVSLEPRFVAIRGAAAPVEVASVRWD